MTDANFLPEPREINLGNGIVRLENAYVLFVRDTHLGTEHTQAQTLGDGEPYLEGHRAYFCRRCGTIWARKVQRAFPLWKVQQWTTVDADCDSRPIVAIDEETLQQPAVMLQVLDAYLLRASGTPSANCQTGF